MNNLRLDGTASITTCNNNLKWGKALRIEMSVPFEKLQSKFSSSRQSHTDDDERLCIIFIRILTSTTANYP